MKELLAIIALSFVFICANAQEVYFSNEPFQLGKTPDRSKCKTEFSDEEFIYGLAIFDQDINELVNSPYECTRDDGTTYYTSSKRLKILFGNAITGTMLDNQSLIVGLNGKTYFFIDVLPEVQYCYFMNDYPLYMNRTPSLSTLMKKYTLEFSCDDAKLAFKQKIKITKSGNYSEDAIRQRRDEFLARDEKKLTYKVDKGRAANEADYSEPIDFFNYLTINKNQKECDYTQPNMSKENLEKLLANYTAHYPNPSTKIIKTYIVNQEIKWDIYKNIFGVITYQKSQPFLIVFDTDPNDDLYLWQTFYLHKEYLGGGNYGEIVLSTGPSSRRHPKAIYKKLID